MTKLQVRQTALSQIKSFERPPINWQPLIDWLVQYENVGMYQPLAGEFNLSVIHKELIQHNLGVSYPSIRDGQMVMIGWQDQQDFVTKDGFMQLQSGDIIVPDILVCPLLAIDQQGYRLGRGGGYYDRYLAAHTLQCFGIAYDWQQTFSFSPDVWDMPLDGCFLWTRMVS